MNILFISINTPSDGGEANFLYINITPLVVSELLRLREVFRRAKKETPTLTQMSFQSSRVFALADNEEALDEFLTEEEKSQLEDSSFVLLRDGFNPVDVLKEVDTEIENLLITEGFFGWSMRDKHSEVLYETQMLSFDEVDPKARDFG